MPGRRTEVKPSLPENGEYTFSGILEVTEIAENETKTAEDIVPEAVPHIISGKVRDENGSLLTDAEGWAYARPENSFRTICSTPVEKGEFSLKVPAGTMYVGLVIVSDGKYIFSQETETSVGTRRASSDVTVTLNAADAVIKGVLQDENGNTVSDVQGKVFAVPEGAGNSVQESSIQNGAYQLRASAGVWLLTYQLDTDKYVSGPADPVRATVGKGSTVTQNLVLTPLNRVVSGQVTDNAGNPVGPGSVRVQARVPREPGETGRAFSAWGLIGADGSFGLFLPPDNTGKRNGVSGKMFREDSEHGQM